MSLTKGTSTPNVSLRKDSNHKKRNLPHRPLHVAHPSLDNTTSDIFCCSLGNVTDEVIAKYIAEQNIDQDEDFQVDG